ncbi:hypothetical protein [Streptomyces sp900116325]|uniref:LexA family protein n=1 Tax=Streptomyces sp. 900116325 TaxID=3154295 RepID=UPI0033B5D38C
MRRDGVLSPRQESILRVIRSSIIECGGGPTVRQIGERVGLSSTSSAASKDSASSVAAAVGGAPAGSAPELCWCAGRYLTGAHYGAAPAGLRGWGRSRVRRYLAEFTGAV